MSASTLIYAPICRIHLINTIKNYTIGAINGTFDASSGVFLIFKLLYESSLNVPCRDMFIVYAAGTVLIWIKTLFFAPYKDERKVGDENFNTFSSSPVGCLINARKTGDTNVQENIEAEKSEKLTTEPISVSLKSLRFWLLVVFNTIMTLRVSSIPAWMLYWLQWTFSYKVLI